MSPAQSAAALPVAHLNAEILAAQAAELLSVSEEYLALLVARGELRHRMTDDSGSLFSRTEVEAWKTGTDRKRRIALDELAAQAQELDLGY